VVVIEAGHGEGNQFIQSSKRAFAKSANHKSTDAKFNYKSPCADDNLALLNATDMKLKTDQ
jgi:hypothetical protein